MLFDFAPVGGASPIRQLCVIAGRFANVLTESIGDSNPVIRDRIWVAHRGGSREFHGMRPFSSTRKAAVEDLGRCGKASAPDRVAIVTNLLEVVVVGCGGHGREVACVAISAGVTLKGFIDDVPPPPERLAPFGAPYLGVVSGWEAVRTVDIVVGIGSGLMRQTVTRRFAASGIAGGLVDPSASVGIDVRLAEGAVVFAQATVTTNVEVGRHAHIGRGAAVGHDCVVGDFVTVMPLASVSGNVVIGDRATVGAGAVVRQGQSIGADAYVGAGAVVVSDVPPGVTVVGNPARPISKSTR